MEKNNPRGAGADTTPLLMSAPRLMCNSVKCAKLKCVEDKTLNLSTLLDETDSFWNTVRRCTLRGCPRRANRFVGSQGDFEREYGHECSGLPFLDKVRPSRRAVADHEQMDAAKWRRSAEQDDKAEERQGGVAPQGEGKAVRDLELFLSAVEDRLSRESAAQPRTEPLPDIELGGKPDLSATAQALTLKFLDAFGVPGAAKGD